MSEKTSMKITIDARDALCEYFKKESLDRDNLLTDEQWKTFVRKNQGPFSELAADDAAALFNEFLEDMGGKN